MSNEEIKEIVVDYVNKINEKYYTGENPCKPYYVDIKKFDSGFKIITCIGTDIAHQKIININCDGVDSFKEKLFNYNIGYYTKRKYAQKQQAGLAMDNRLYEQCEKCNKILQDKNIELKCIPEMSNISVFNKTSGSMQLIYKSQIYQVINAAYINYDDDMCDNALFGKTFEFIVTKFLVENRISDEFERSGDWYRKGLGIIAMSDDDVYDLCNPNDLIKLRQIVFANNESNHTIVFGESN